MKSLIILSTITLTLFLTIIYDFYSFNRVTKYQNLKDISSKIIYLKPQTQFKSKDYKEFIYAN